ncbi:aminotransferase class IV [Psychrobacter sp. FBL11]|uniref:Aminotransferase class IV n=1 Tax=Psychrobacter saeujeotis TaxID=3143436 RepID=A0ABU9X927_9GAMM|nr:aminotransferase class IV [uncultured Psychrobacter sp.]
MMAKLDNSESNSSQFINHASITNYASTWQRLYPQSDNMVANTNNSAITPDNRGLAYGDGFFTTIGVIDGSILWPEYHYQRLLSHAHALQLAVDSDSLLATLQAHAQQLQQGVIKVIVTRAVQAVRGYGFAADMDASPCEVWSKATAMTIDTAQHAQLPDGHSVLIQPMTSAVCLTAQLACLPPSLAGLKSLNRLDNVLASGELQRLKAKSLKSNAELGVGEGIGIGEGLVRDISGSWVEGTMSNVFYQLSSAQSTDSSDKAKANYPDDSLLSGQWFTPPLMQSGVAGVMRQVIIDAFAKTKTPVIVRALNDDDLPNLTQMFFCNALRGVMPVKSLALLSGEVVEFG